MHLSTYRSLVHRLSRRLLSTNPLESGDHIANLKDVRSVIRLSGPTLIHFLQGLVTNDVTLLAPSPAADTPPPHRAQSTSSSMHEPTTTTALPLTSMYSCILNPQGRYLHDLFIYTSLHETPQDTNTTTTTTTTTTLYLDVDAQGKGDIIRLLKRYRLREKIEIDDLSQDYNVVVRFPPASPESSFVSWPDDPRIPSLGQRTILSSSSFSDTAHPHHTPSLLLNQRMLQTSSPQSYVSWRLAHGVAEGDSEIPTTEAIALEYNIDGLHGISFTKGCYVGQELMARTHFKGVVRKRIMPFEIVEGSVDVGETLSVMLADGSSSSSSSAPSTISSGSSSSSGRKRGSTGTVRIIDGTARGLAMIKLADVLPGILDTTGIAETLLLRGDKGGAIVRPWRPDWWSKEWGNEQQ